MFRRCWLPNQNNAAHLISKRSNIARSLSIGACAAAFVLIGGVVFSAPSGSSDPMATNAMAQSDHGRDPIVLADRREAR